MGLLRDHWKQLEGAVHPLDLAVLERPGHSFNLDFPPPAFVGDPEAPIVLLMANGGYKPGITEAEFVEPADQAEHIAYLRGERREMPRRLSSYYGRGTIGDWLVAGKAVSVNAVPYRSPRLSSEPENRSIAKSLPSVAMHRRWLLEEVLPAALAGERFLLVHRNSWWQVPREAACATVLFSDPLRAEPNRAAPDAAKLAAAATWLQSRSDR